MDRSELERSAPLRVGVVYQILHHFREPIFDELTRRNLEASGLEYHFYAAAENELDSNRTIDPARAGLAADAGGLRWTFIGNVALGGPFFWQTGVIRAALSRRSDVMIFLGNMYYASTWMGALLARLRGKRVLFWGHGYRRREGGLKGWLRSRFNRLAHGLLLYGWRARDLLVERGFDPARLHVVNNSLDYERQREVREGTSAAEVEARRRQLFADPEAPILVCIGRLERRKRLDLLLEAAARLRAKGSPVNVLLLGDGADRAALEEHVRRLDLADRVRFQGAVYDEAEIGPLMMASTLCVCPGDTGLTVLHAMAYGLPVITHDGLETQGPEVELIVRGQTGDLFRAGAGEDLAERVAAWIDTGPSRESVAQRCIARVEAGYTPRSQAELIDAAVLGKPPSPRPVLGTPG